MEKKTITTSHADNVSVTNIPLDQSIIQDKSLSLFQKVLLTTDGTVTDLLKLYTGEKIKVKIINQEVMLSGDSEVSLCSPKTPILKRSVLLGSETKNYVYAESIFIFEQFSQPIQNKLLETNEPIGLLWKEEKLENYREIISYKTESCESLLQYFSVQPQTPMLSRTYLIYHKRSILGVITEKFPVNFFRGDVI